MMISLREVKFKVLRSRICMVKTSQNYTGGKVSYILSWLEWEIFDKCKCPRIILGMRPANKRQCHKVMSPVIGWAHTQNAPCLLTYPSSLNSIYIQDPNLFITASADALTPDHASTSADTGLTTKCKTIFFIDYSTFWINFADQLLYFFNSLRPRQNWHHLADDIFKYGMEMYEFRLRFHWSLFLMAQLIKFQHWFRKWLGADQATSHYPDRWW